MSIHHIDRTPAEREAFADEKAVKLDDAKMCLDIATNSLRWDLDQVIQTTSELCSAVVDGRPWEIVRAAEARGVAKYKFELALRRFEQHSREVHRLEKPGRSL